jgi:hypothetical protein
MASIRQNDNNHANATPFSHTRRSRLGVPAQHGPINLRIIPDASCSTIAPFDHLKFDKRYCGQHLFR